MLQRQLLQQLRLTLSQRLTCLLNRPLVANILPCHKIARLVLLVEGSARLPVHPFEEATPDFAHGCDDALGYTEFFIFEASCVKLFIKADNLAVGEIARVLQCDAFSAADDVATTNFGDYFD